MNKMTAKISDADLRAWASLGRTCQLSNDLLTLRLQPLGLKLPEFQVLVSLLREPDQTQQQLAQGCFKVKSHMSALLTSMTEYGWVKRRESEIDKRSNVITLTTKGMVMAKKAASIENKIVAAMLGPLTAKQIREIEHVMDQISLVLRAS